MERFTEKDLDKAIEAKFRKSGEFVTWFLSRTKFANRAANLVHLRSNHPWYQSETTGVQSETDILVVFEDAGGSNRFAIHIENKLSSGSFTENQPDLYRERAAEWVGREKYGNYDDFEVVLIAPRAFYERNGDQCRIFDRYVAHEDIAEFIPEFGG